LNKVQQIRYTDGRQTKVHNKLHKILKKTWLRWSSWHSAKKAGHTPDMESPLQWLSAYHMPRSWSEVSETCHGFAR